MMRIVTRALPLLVALALPMAAFAQAPAPVPAAAPAPADREAHMAQRMEEHFHRMHEKLHITAAQEPAFAAFVQTIKDNMAAGRAMHEAHHGKLDTASALDLMHWRSEGAAAHAAAAAKTEAAFATLYSQFSPEQKTAADAEAREMARHMMHRWHHEGHDHHE